MQLPRFEDLAASRRRALGPARARARRRPRHGRRGRRAGDPRPPRYRGRPRLGRQRSAHTPRRSARCLARARVRYTASAGTPSSTTGRRTRCWTASSSVAAACRSCSQPSTSKSPGGPMCRSPASDSPATTSSRTSVAPSRCCSIRSTAASKSQAMRPRRSYGPGPHTRPRCACSTTWSPRSRSAVILRARSAPPNCDSRFRPDADERDRVRAELASLRARFN